MTPLATEMGLAEDFDVFDRLVDIVGLAVVDVGCGRGQLSQHLVARGAQVVAVESDPVQAAANRIAFDGDTASADLVVFGKSLHHVPIDRMDSAVREALRVLKPAEGMLYVLEQEVEGTYSELMRPFHDETEARNAAAECHRRIAHPIFVDVRVVRFRNVRRYKSFEDFVDAVCGASFNCVERPQVDSPTVRARFAAGRSDDGFAFEQPMRVELFRGRRSA